METRDSLPCGAACFVSGVFGGGGVVALPVVELLKLADGFGFLGFGGIVGIEDGFELLLLFVEGAGGLGVVEGEVALLETGVAFEDDGLAGGRVCQGGQTELLAVEIGDFGHEVDAIDWALVRVVEQPSDVEQAEFVSEESFLAVEDEVPDAEVFGEGVTGERSPHP